MCCTNYFFTSSFKTKNITLNLFSYYFIWQGKINIVYPSKLLISRVAVVFDSLLKSNFKFILIL